MKHLITGLVIAWMSGICMVQGQESKLLLEIGGALGNSKSTSEAGINFSTTTKDSKINAQVGLALGTKSFIGLRYGFAKSTENQTSIQENEYSYARNVMGEVEKIHTFGMFYRYYFLPFNQSRFNTFLEIDPSYQRRQQTISSAYESYYVDSEGLSPASISYSEVQQGYHGIDLDLKVGTSYRLSKKFHIQFSLSSVANVNHTFKNPLAINYGEEEQRTAFRVFTNPLANAHLSVLFVL